MGSMKYECIRCKGKGTNMIAGFTFSCKDCFGLGYKVAHSKPISQFYQSDSPTKPSHYGKLDVFTYAKEHFTVDEVNAYHQITAIKYITRAGKKDGNPYEQDIKKAITHLQECLKGEEG